MKCPSNRNLRSLLGWAVCGTLIVLFYIPRTTPADIAPQPNLVTDVRARQLSNKKYEQDVSDLAQKFIVVGSTREDAVQYLATLGFKVYADANNIEKDVYVLGILERLNSRWLNLLPLRSELRIVVLLRGDRAASVNGNIYYRGIP
jgi:hypothetical protein